MPRSFFTLPLTALVVATACTKEAAPPPPAVQWAVIVLYNQPKDTAAFEKYYAEKHVPLFASHAQEIGVTRAELVRFSPSADGKPAPIYREADLRWDSQEARDKGMATAGFKAVAADLPVFATGGFTVLVGTKTN